MPTTDWLLSGSDPLKPPVVALSIVNMIFRGDGKNNIVEGDGLQRNLVRSTNGTMPTAKWSPAPPRPHECAVTKVLMNPPFALKKSDEKEYRFVEQALRQMQDGGILFSVLPYSAMVRPAGYLTWRRERLLPHHTLLSVVTFQAEFFYPIGVRTIGIFIQKGVPHPTGQSVLWLRALNDGMLKSKGKRLPHPKAVDDFPRFHDTLKAFLINPRMSVKNVEMFQKASPIDSNDKLLELVPENYLDQSAPNDYEIKNGIERILRESVAYMIQSKREDEYAD